MLLLSVHKWFHHSLQLVVKPNSHNSYTGTVLSITSSTGGCFSLIKIFFWTQICFQDHVQVFQCVQYCVPCLWLFLPLGFTPVFVDMLGNWYLLWPVCASLTIACLVFELLLCFGLYKPSCKINEVLSLYLVSYLRLIVHGSSKSF